MKGFSARTKARKKEVRKERLSETAGFLMRSCLVLIALLSLEVPGGAAQGASNPAAVPAPPPSAVPKKSATELQKLSEPIALHPDSLIAIVLPAAAYPLEIVQAARFVKDTNNIPKVDAQPWDDNVKAAAKFPEMIAKMDQDLRWTMDLGQAFIDQPKELMDAIQALRKKAKELGNLKTTDQQIVTVTNVVVLQTNVTEVVNVTREIIEVVPANPSVIYVPSYPTTIYYPWYPYYPYPAPLVSFGVGFAWGMFWGAAWGNHCNWGHGHVDIDIDSNRNINRNTDRNSNRVSDRMNNRGDSGRQQWKPDQNRMRQSGAKPGNREARGWGSSGARPSTGNIGTRPSTGNMGARPSTGNVGTRPSTGNVGTRPSTGTVGSRPSTGNVGARPSTSQSSPRTSYQSSPGSAFDRSNGGSNTRANSYRGGSSRGGGGFSGGSRGGGGRGGGGRR